VIAGGDVGQRGLRERIETGVYRQHAVNCPVTEKGSRRECSCPYWVSGGRGRTATVTGDKKAARKKRLELLTARPVASAAPRAAAPPDVKELFGAYFRSRLNKISHKQQRDEAQLYRAYVRGTVFEGLPVPLAEIVLGRISLEHLDAWSNGMHGLYEAARKDEAAKLKPSRPCSHRNLQKAHELVARVFAFGVEREYLSKSPAAHIGAKKRESNNHAAVRDVLSSEQLRMLVRGCDQVHERTMIRAASEACLRKGEVIGLLWNCVDLDARTIEIRAAAEQWTSEDGLVKRLKGVKNNEARTLRISSAFAEDLRVLREGAFRKGASQHSPVWPGRDGCDSLLNDRSPNRVLKRAVVRANAALDAESKSAGPRPESERLRVTFHGLRHTGASLLLGRGEPLINVSRFLGHKSIDVTARIYAHIANPDQTHGVADQWDAFWSS
jgi:integrase